MFQSKRELLEWHQKGVVTTMTCALYLVFKYHASPVEIFTSLKLQHTIGMH